MPVDIMEFRQGYTTESQIRERIVATARAWIGTPYRPCWCERGVGCDCASFLVGVFSEAGVIPRIDLGYYDYGSAMNKRGGDADYLAGLNRFGCEIDMRDVLPGDVVMYKMGRGWSHSGIIITWPGEIIHATIHGVVSSPATSGRLAGRPMRFWSFFEKLKSEMGAAQC